jgi:DNA-binding NarL/FixJ family response regulator
MLAEVRERARRSGFDAVSVRADELDQYAAGAALQRALQPHGPAGPAAVATEDERLRLLDGMTDALEDRAQRAPVVVIVDDVQWADPATLFALRTLPGRLAASRILWVLAIRPETDRPIVVRMSEDLERLGARRLSLGPLPQQELLHIAADVLGARPSSELAGLLRGIAGNPFLAIELVRAFADAGAVKVESGVAVLQRHDIPVGFRRSVAARLERLPEDAVRLLQIGSVLGREFDLGRAARMLGRQVGSMLSGIEAALEADLLSADAPRLAFRHGLIRQAVHENLPPAVRSALHREAADDLRSTGGRPAEVAWHVVLAGGPVDDEAVSTLHTAVRELSATAPDAAADLAQRIAGLLSLRDPRRITLLTEAAEYLGRTRRVHEALQLVDATLPDVREPLQEASLRLVAAEIHQAAGDDVAAMTHLRQALDLPGLPYDLRVRLLKTKATGHVYLGEIAAAEQTDIGLVDAAYRSQDPALVVSAMVFESQTSFYRGRLAHALDLAERACARGGAESAALYLRPPRISALWLATVLTTTDRLADTERVLREGQRAAEALGLGWSLPHWHACRAAALLERGALDDAAVEAEASLTVADELEITRWTDQARSVLALVDLRRGDLARAREHLSAGRAGSGAETEPKGPWAALARACLEAAEGKDAAAAAALGTGFPGVEPARLLVVPPSHWPEIVRVAVHADEPSVAQAVAGALNRITAQDDSPQIVRATRDHVNGLLHGDHDALESAVTGYRSSGRPLVLAAACADLGELITASADPAPAIPYFEEAAQLAAASGAAREHERLRRRLRQLGVRSGAVRQHAPGSPGWGSLTESERKLIPLVVEGLTNRAIAERLYVSVHTVNTHMKHIFTKLGINTRVELTRLAIERGDAAGEPG